MSFEKHMLLIAEEVGIENAYFYEGSMVFSADDVTIDMIDNFVEYAENALVNTEVVMNYVGDEVIVDFKLRYSSVSVENS